MAPDIALLHHCVTLFIRVVLSANNKSIGLIKVV